MGTWIAKREPRSVVVWGMTVMKSRSVTLDGRFVSRQTIRSRSRFRSQMAGVVPTTNCPFKAIDVRHSLNCRDAPGNSQPCRFP